ncbi:hypothetical protein N9980_01455 [bacterium]|nr:hypothetical protein [bacterium]
MRARAMVLTGRHALWITFAVLAMWIFATRWTLQYEPLERDITTYAVAGREILAGRALYSDLWDHKPPGIHLIFAGATALVGPGVPAVLLVNVALSIIVMGGLMSAARRIAGTPGAIIVGVLWAIVGGDLGLQANQPNVELPMNACIAWALAASFAGRSRPTFSAAWATGALTACGILLKPVVAAPLGLLAVVDASERWRRGGAPATLDFLGRWFAGVFLGLVPVMTWCVLRAGYEPVWDALVRYNLAYGEGRLLANLFEFLHIWTFLPLKSGVVIGLLALAGITGLREMTPSDRSRVLAVLVGSAIAISAPGRFYPHYFQLLLPPLVLAAAIGLTHALSRTGVRRLIALTAVATLGIIQLQSLRLPADEWSRQKYGEVFLDERRLAVHLKKYLNPGDSFWQLGAQPGLYLLTETVPASGVLYDYPLLQNSPVRERLAARVIVDLAKSRPRTIVVHDRGGDRGVFSWIRKHYRIIDDVSPVERYWLLALDDSKSLNHYRLSDSPELPILVDGFGDGTTTGRSQHPAGDQERTALPPCR